MSPPPRGWWLLFLLSVGVAGYAGSFLILGERVFPAALADSFRARPWGIFPHAGFGMLALLAVPLQFHPRVQRRAGLHRRIGQIYVLSAFLAGAFGLYMALHSHGGMVTHLGFGLLGVGTMGTTAMAYLRIRVGDVTGHRSWMIRSAALILAAVTLRLWLPLLVLAAGGAFTPAYRWVSWLCWVPNVAVAEWYLARTRDGPLHFGGRELSRRSTFPLSAATPLSAPARSGSPPDSPGR